MLLLSLLWGDEGLDWFKCLQGSVGAVITSFIPILSVRCFGWRGSALMFIVLMEPSESVSRCCFSCMVTIVIPEVSETESMEFWGLFPM